MADDEHERQHSDDASMNSVSLRNQLTPTAIMIIFDECSRPYVYILANNTLSFRLCHTLALSFNEGFERRERNRLIFLGCLADYLSGPITTRILEQETMEYLSAFLDAQSPSLALKCYNGSPNSIRQNIGFCTRWLLDNICLVPEIPLSFTTVETPNQNSVLDLRGVTDFPEVSAEGLTAPCDPNSFEYVRCAFQIDSGNWFYEAQIMKEGVMQVGWGAGNTQMTTRAGYGVAENQLSLTYDGCRPALSHQTEPNMRQDMAMWRQGNILRCFIDVGKKKAFFTMNGVRLSVCKDIFMTNGTPSGNTPQPRNMLFAAATLKWFQSLRFNFESHQFSFAPLCHANYSQMVPRWMYLEKANALQAARNENIDDTCIICYDKTIQTSARPCFHMSFCYDCAARITKCPLCRKPIWMVMPEEH